jgi:hypothetical protein
MNKVGKVVAGARLRRAIKRSLRAQGFDVCTGIIRPKQDLTKDQLRELHRVSVKHLINEETSALQNGEY